MRKPGVASAPQGLSVSAVTRIVRERLEGAPELASLWITGEASNVRLAGSGHLYFTLKDETAQLKCVYFSFSRSGKRAPPADGQVCLVHGAIRVYERGGEYQLLCDDIVKAGQGDLAARFEELKQRLSAEGLFGEERKVALPALPQCIAIVTGIATAALQDVLNVLRRRAPYLRVIIFPASVQGDGAPPELISALRAADACPDVEAILLVRGGGSIEDLWCFNDEKLARALAEIRRPVISGVGHEIDFTIADFVADRRAPTPSAAAELVAPDSAELRNSISLLARRAQRDLARQLDSSREALARLFDRRLLRDVSGRVSDARQGVDSLGSELVELMALRTHGTATDQQWYAELLARMAGPLTRELERREHVLPLLRDDVLRAGRHKLEELGMRVGALDNRVRGLDPRAPLAAGFALVWREGSSGPELLRDAGKLAAGERVRVELKDSSFTARREGSEES